jgi:hypothetical protein
MKIFVGYGYNDRDKWIEEHVFGLIRAFGGEPISGKEIYGQQLEDGVRRQIRECDAFLGFTTRRDQLQNGRYTTHRWVTDEIIVARESEMPFLEIRETAVDEQGGMPGGRQHVACDPDHKESCLVAIALAISKWRLNMPTKLQFLPEHVANSIRPHMNKKGFRCSYKILKGGVESAAKKTNIVPIKGGLFTLVPSVDPMALIQIKIDANGKRWTSEYESVDAVSIRLTEV